MKVTVFRNCSLPHASQIFTGFFILDQEKIINLVLLDMPIDSDVLAFDSCLMSDLPGVLAVIKGKKYFFDLLDSPELSQKIYNAVDFYFKRSYARDGYGNAEVFPLGFNFEVYLDRFDHREVFRYIALNFKNMANLKQKLGVFLDAVGVSFLPRLKEFDSIPKRTDGQYSVLFLARTWDPLEQGISLNENEREDRFKINLQRAKLLRHLKKELGSKFYGGFSKTQHSVAEFPDLVVEDRQITKKKNYLNIVRSTPICVATTGLHGSFGWKFAEYIALSRAIVSERSELLAPCDFSEGKHYLGFEGAEECMKNIDTLLNDDMLVQKMMTVNREYYLEFLRPDVLIYNALIRCEAFIL